MIFRNKRFELILLLCALAVFACTVIISTALSANSGKENITHHGEGVLDELDQYDDTIVVSKDITIDTSVIEEILEPCAELVTYKYYYTDAGVFEKNQKLFNTDVVLPFTTDRTIYKYSGVISTGVDLKDVVYDVDNPGKTITVTLPQPKILSHEIDTDSFEYQNVEDSIFTTSDLGDYQAFQDELKKYIEEKLNADSGYWSQCRTNTEKTIKELLAISDAAKEYTVICKWNQHS
ncbi:MAG: DUF4230 domain-containing protein [Solobacterium sp.]|nr:DUF4230 domain-containing protein [Solobacterium sp.]